MRLVHKHVVHVSSFAAAFTQVLRIHEPGKLLHVDQQHGNISLWFEVDDELPKVERKFQLFGTGHGPIGPHLSHRGTVPLDSGKLVLHVYEVAE